MPRSLARRQRIALPLLIGFALTPAVAVQAADAAAKRSPKKATKVSANATTRLSPADATSTAGRASGCKKSGSGWLVGGSCRWTTTLTFDVAPGSYEAAALTLKLSSKVSATVRIRGAAGTALAGKELDSAKGAGGTTSFDVRRAVPTGGGTVALVVESTSSSPKRFSSPRLALALAGGGSMPELPGSPVTAPRPPVVTPPPATAPLPSPAPTPAPPGAQPQPLPPTSTGAVWLAQGEVRALPMSGGGWSRVKAAADGGLGTPDVANQDSSHDVNTLAAALVFARTGTEGYRTKVAAAISGAIGTEAGGRTLALARNLNPYVLAADLIDLRTFDPSLDQRFRTWLSSVRTKDLQGLTLISTHEKRPNNWGTMAGASRIAADLYLGDTADLAKAAAVFRGYLGDRSAYAGFSWGDLSFQADASKPVGINPPGATKSGVSVDGAIPDDMRRGCTFQPVPCHTNYAWEALQGVVVQAELLARHGQPAFAWSGNAILRATQYLDRLEREHGGWWAASDDQWQPWIINHAYGTSFPASYGSPGKVMGWTDWVYGG